MSKDSWKGSIILKLLIVVLSIVLIAVILIPGKVWDQEEAEQKTEHYNIISIYEALRFYHRNTQSFTTSPAEILKVVRSDSSILIQQKVVNYTQQLTSLIDSYLEIIFIESIIEIDQNIDRIIEDIENNRRNFNIDENIKNEAEDLQLKLKELNYALDYSKYVASTGYLDTLIQLRRDLTDYSLQSGASRSSEILNQLESLLNQINLSGFENSWIPLSTRLNSFTSAVRRSEELSKVTSFGDRAKDFTENVNDAFKKIKTTNIQQDLVKANQLNKQMQDLYATFLKDFIVTSKLALYRLSEADSLVIHLTESNFYSPITNEMYKIIITEDTSAAKVESPVLLKELKEVVNPITEKINDLPTSAAFQDYFEMLESIKNKAFESRKALRKNTDVFIKYKEIEEIINRFADISVTMANKDLDNFKLRVPKSESYSNIETYTENALNGVRIFKQAFEQQIFGNLDTLQKELFKAMDEFNTLLSGVGRLPAEAKKFENEAEQLKQLESRLKGLSVIPQLSNLEKDLGAALEFMAEGKEVMVFGLFKKKVKNMGYIFKDTKSWEEEKD